MNKLFSISVAILPLIMVYRSPIPQVDLGTFWILCISIPLIISSKKGFRFHRNVPLLFLIAYTFISTLVSILILNNPNYLLVLLRMSKWVILIFVVVFVYSENFFKFDIGLKALRVVSLLAVSYLIIQTITYYSTGIILPRGFLGLVTDPSYSQFDYAEISRKVFYRPTAFFIEPASFVQYTILYLTYCIFGLKKQPVIHNVKEALFITMGIIMTGSGQGLILLVGVWGIWFMRRVVFTIGAKQLILGMCVVAMAIVFIPVLLDIPIVAGNIERAFDFEQGGLGYAGIARIRNYSYLIEFPLLFKFIGMGYGNVPVDTYLPSLAYTLYSSGLIGGLLVLCFFINMYRKTIHFQNVFVILYGILIIGSTAFFALNVCFYLPFLTYNSNRSDSFTEVQQAHGRTA